MLAVSTTGWWAIGYALAGAVVVIAASLLLAIIALARRIVRQAGEITEALDGARRNTEPLFDIGMVNHTIEAITRGLKRLRSDEGGDETGGGGWLKRVSERLAPGQS